MERINGCSRSSPLKPNPKSDNPMKANALLLIAGFSTWLASAAPTEQANEIVIGLSPFQPAAERARQQSLLQRFFVTDAPNGSRIIAWDAWELRVIADAQLPRLAYDTPAARAPRVAPALVALKQWFGGLDGKQTPTGLKDSSAIAVPQFLQAATVQPATGRRAIVILGSPFCLVPNEPSFSMTETRYPSDGHLNAGDKSIYSLADRRERLANTTVLWAYGSESVWASQNHRERVARWWTLFIAGQGPNAMLAAFSADAPQVLLAATGTNHHAIGKYSVNPDDTALLMHEAGERQVPVKSEAHQAPPPEPVQQPASRLEAQPAPSNVAVVTVIPLVEPASRAEAAPISREAEPPAKPVEETVVAKPVLTEIPKPALGNIGIAAVWNAAPGTDIDLWVAASAGAPEAYWNRPRVPRVRYSRDIRTARSAKDDRQWQAAWEYVEVEGATVTEPTVWLNVYSAKGPVSGIVRVQFDGHVVDRPFQFNVARGNRGRDSDKAARVQSPYWQQVKLADFLQLPGSEAFRQSP